MSAPCSRASRTPLLPTTAHDAYGRGASPSPSPPLAPAAYRSMGRLMRSTSSAITCGSNRCLPSQSRRPRTAAFRRSGGALVRLASSSASAARSTADAAGSTAASSASVASTA
uniref:Uncharacterized protein n=1 Tax=Zea mays TaxID=4577 RepID=C4J3M4_MAIZE|nr:unknown [Zea mays]